MTEIKTDYPIKETFRKLGLDQELLYGACTGQNWLETGGKKVESVSPADGETIGTIKLADKEDYEKVMQTAQDAFKKWRIVPAPQRGDIVRQMGLALRENKEALGAIVSYEMGKIYQEGLGEVQEMIDIADFATGQARMLYGMNTHSERPNHKLSEQYHPLGPIGIITAFNFPVAVWAWNTMNALIGGDTVIWKPSSKVAMCAISVMNIMQKVLKDNDMPEGVINMIAGKSKDIGDVMLEDKRLPLISATGSTPLGRRVAEKVGKRLGRTILELGGNNAIIVSEHADLDMAVRATIFGAVGTTGQRCTTTRRMIVSDKVYDTFKEKLVSAYKQLPTKIGHPLNEDTLVGPMIDTASVGEFQNAMKQVEKEGGKVIFGGEKVEDSAGVGTYVVPAIAEVENKYEIVQEETFAPLLYLIKYSDFDEALELHNDVPQGLSSAVFTQDVHESQKFLSAVGSDCGIANVNIGTSGAEIGGAFGGEKDTGGGRESGSDAWKNYMRRQTNTINYGKEMPLAQGIEFDI
ncbi:MAG: aldehyde dehydrogenase family protein [Bacteroidales bacterium]|nr:aldehyde dehydrogenase family protein [Bacteroidales bacterium]MCF8332842.1 aldehyde dehydrogenase family protein [Bacteroidales bacterium]